ncbi:MAG: hypothetical protein Greene041679_204 [Parcubacteria group bacterium Greene0416_79]|nr:MAG: hypothetical protein Greene041679_204 [Parcubacteria group bacterium Greene0416_79]
MKTWNLGYEKAKQRAKSIYSKIGRLACPAFGGEFVAFTSDGFSHLLRKGRIPRTRNEQKRRFALMSYVAQIIKNPKAAIVYERRDTKTVVNRHGDKITLQSVANFWTFAERIDGCKIRVVVRQLSERGGKHFFSVMGDNIKITRRVKRKRSTKKPRN